MDSIKFCVCALGIGLVIGVLRRQSSDIAPLAAATAAVILAGSLVVYAVPLILEIQTLSDALGGAKPYISVLLKALGIAITSKTCADICRDCGESAIAAKIESAGKIGILLLSLPVLRSIVGMLGQLVG